MDTLETIQKENSELRKKIETHDDDLKRLRCVLYQLIGGIFNQKTQRYVMSSYIDDLFGTSSSEQEAETEAETEAEAETETEETQWPTTRQGDNNEERIRKLEETIQKLEKQIENMEKRQRIGL